MTTLTGFDAITHAAVCGIPLRKHADPIDGAREVDADEARSIAREDASLIYCETEDALTDARLDEIASSLDDVARELAHSRVAPCDAPTFARAYVLALAGCLGARASAQCGAGDAWSPSEWLASDLEAVTDACDVLGVRLGDVAREAWGCYRDPPMDALRACEVVNGWGERVVAIDAREGAAS